MYIDLHVKMKKDSVAFYAINNFAFYACLNTSGYML